MTVTRKHLLCKVVTDSQINSSTSPVFVPYLPQQSRPRLGSQWVAAPVGGTHTESRIWIRAPSIGVGAWVPSYLVPSLMRYLTTGQCESWITNRYRTT